MDEETKKLLDDHEMRIKQLETALLSGKSVNQKQHTGANNNHSGLNGGIRLILEQGFLNQPKSLNEISVELKRLGYHYSVKSLSKALLIDFMKKWQMITRFEESKVWKYVVRK